MSLSENKLLIIGFQISLIIHLILFILLHFLPMNVLDLDYNKPIQITVEEIKEEMVQKKVKIENQVKNNVKKEEKESVKTVEKIKEKQNTVKTPITDSKSTSTSPHLEKNQDSKPSNPDILKIDSENLKLLNQLASGSTHKETSKLKNEEISFGESLSKIDSSVSGSGSSRSVIYKPLPPKITTSETLPPVKVKIWINPDGNVSKVELLTTTGDPQVNSVIITYMKRWKFNKINSDEIQWATLTIRFGS